MSTDELIDAITALKVFHRDPPPWLTHHLLDKSGKTDWVRVQLFLHILSKYNRLPDGNRQFAIENDMYNLDRQEVAESLHTDPDTISEKLTTLVDEDKLVVRALRRVRTRKGSIPLRCYVAPVLETIKKLMTQYQRPPRFEVLEELDTNLRPTPPAGGHGTPNPPLPGQVAGCRKARQEPVERQAASRSKGPPLEGNTYSSTDTKQKNNNIDGDARQAADASGVNAAEPESQKLDNDPGAAPQTPVVFSPSEAGASPPAPPPQEEEEDKETECGRFLSFYLDWYNLSTGKELSQVSRKDAQAIKGLFEDDSILALYAAAVWIETQNLAKTTASNGYQYFACKHSNTLTGFVRNWDKVIQDVEVATKGFASRSDFDDFQAIQHHLLELANWDSEVVARIVVPAFPDVCEKMVQAKKKRTELSPASAPAKAPAPKPQPEVNINWERYNQLSSRCKELRLPVPPPARSDAIQIMTHSIQQAEVKAQMEKVRVKVRAVPAPLPAAVQPKAVPKEPGTYVNGVKVSDEEAHRIRTDLAYDQSSGDEIEIIPGPKKVVEAKPAKAFTTQREKKAPSDVPDEVAAAIASGKEPQDFSNDPWMAQKLKEASAAPRTRKAAPVEIVTELKLEAVSV